MNTREKFIRWLQDELRPKKLLPSLTSGMLMGITEVIFALSVGSLIFSGKLVSHLSYGIGIALTTAAIMLIGISLSSSIPGVTGSLQDSSSVILTVIVSTLAVALPNTQTEDRLPTILMAIVATTLLTGIFFFTLGSLKLGGLVRFIPYPVVGGFLAGTGWLLVQGSFSVMADVPLTLSKIPMLFQSNQMISWIPGVIFAFVLFLGLRRVKHFLALPVILLGSLILFYLTLLVFGFSTEEASGLGLFLGRFPDEATWQPISVKHFLAADWSAIIKQSGNIVIILIVSVVCLLLNASALELAFRKDIDLNHELRVAGLVNILSGLGGGAVGFHALDLSTLCSRIGVRGRIPGLVAGIICVVMLFVGAPLLAFFPKPFLGGLLFFMGLGFLVEWVIDGWSKLPRTDYAIILLILIVIATTNFLIGVGVGLAAMIILFVLNYSHISVVRFTLTGAEMKSNVERCAHHQRELRELGQHIFILELQGFLFFGTANALMEQIRERIKDTKAPKVHYIIMDFRNVTGLDSSAVMSFSKVRQLAEEQGSILVFSGISNKVRNQLLHAGLLEDNSPIQIFPDLDHSLEWCEEQLLEIKMITKEAIPVTLQAQLVQSGFEKADAIHLMKYLKKVQFEEGEYLIRQGDKSDDLYFIELGRVSVYLEVEGGRPMRLRTLDLGTIVGEMGLYLDTTRTASVITDSQTVAYRLTETSLTSMTEKEPKLAAAFHEFVVRRLSERLIATNRLLEEVLR